MRPMVLALLLVTIVVGVLCGTVALLPVYLGRPLLLATHILVPTSAIAVIAYGRGVSRAFAIGSMIPLGISLYVIANTAAYWIDEDWLVGVDNTAALADQGFFNAVVLCTAVICGLLTVCISRFLNWASPTNGR
jgi:hypothetical protein